MEKRSEDWQVKRTIVAAAFAVLASSSAPLTFEVASIKPSAPDARGIMFQSLPGGGVRVTGFTLKMLLAMAYDVRDFQIAGGPGWINTDRYDILAKSERTAGLENVPDNPRQLTEEQRKTIQEQMEQRLQALMAERFHLAVHRETKEQPVYALVVGKSGSKLQPAKQGNQVGIRMGRGQMTAEGAQIQMLVPTLANILGRPVIDKTGLTENFDFKLEWTPDPGQGNGFGSFGPVPPGLDAQPPSDPNGPSIFTALQEQLGLRLESEKGPVEMIVIDRVEKPSEN